MQGLRLHFRKALKAHVFPHFLGKQGAMSEGCHTPTAALAPGSNIVACSFPSQV